MASRIWSRLMPAIALTWPDWPLIATESLLKSEFAATEGSAAPLTPAVPLPVSVSLESDVTRLRLSAPLPASWRIASAGEACAASALACSCYCSAAREASNNWKFTRLSWLAAFKSASCDPGAKAANCVRMT